MKLVPRPVPVALVLTLVLTLVPVATADAQPALPDLPPPEGAGPSAPPETAPAEGEPAPAPPPSDPAQGEPPARSVSRPPEAIPLPILGAPLAPASGPDFAFEVSTRGLGDGALRSGVLVGAGSRRLVLGLALGFDRVRTKADDDVATWTSVAVGPALRVRLGGTDDGQVELFGALDLQGVLHTVSGRDSGGDELPTPEPSLAIGVGPGIRLWLHERVALAALARFSRTAAGERTFTASDAERSFDVDVDVDVANIRLEGAFSLLGLF